MSIKFDLEKKLQSFVSMIKAEMDMTLFLSDIKSTLVKASEHFDSMTAATKDRFQTLNSYILKQDKEKEAIKPMIVDPPHPSYFQQPINMLAAGQMKPLTPDELTAAKKKIGSVTDMNYDIPETPFNVNPFRKEGLKQIVPIVDNMVKKYCPSDAKVKQLADQLADTVQDALNVEPDQPLKIADVCTVIEIMQELHNAWEKPITDAKQKDIEAKKH